MLSVHQTLSLRYLQRRWLRALLIVTSIALGVGTLVATRALNETMAKAAEASTNPMAGIVDFIVSNGERPVARTLSEDIRKVPGVKSVTSRIFKNVYLQELDKNVLLLGLDLKKLMEESKNDTAKKADLAWSTGTEAAYVLAMIFNKTPVIPGKALDDDLSDNTKPLHVSKDARSPLHELTRVGYVEARNELAWLGGYVLVVDLAHAARILELKDEEVHCLDVVLEPTAQRDVVRKELDKQVKNRAQVRTPGEQNQSLQSVMSGMQTGFSLCGVAALVVGIFLVYNSLAVTVAERRHEIGILLAVGATRVQVWSLFAGEAGLLGLVGSLLGIPLGIQLAKIGLAPMQNLLKEIFMSLTVHQVEVSTFLMVLAVLAGVLTSIAAALVPAVQAARESPAEAVRRLPKATPLHHLVMQASISASLVVIGTLLILMRDWIPYKLGTYGGLILVLVGALVASPFFAAVTARLFQPLARRLLSIEWRLAADNIVRSPGRTGLVIGALAAGVSLVVQTSGTIRSNRLALNDWIEHTYGADLFVTAEGPVSAGQEVPMDESIGAELAKLADVEAVLPGSKIKVPWTDPHIGDTYIALVSMNAGQEYLMEGKRLGRTPHHELINELSKRPNTALMSENFAALYHVRTGDNIVLHGENEDVPLKVIGQVVDYNWNHGTLIINRDDFKKYWPRDQNKVNAFDIYLRNGVDPRQVREIINRNFGYLKLWTMTRSELQQHIDGMIGRLYGIAYAQQMVVMLVAALGVVTALLISVLQRRRELGLLRAIGASRTQVIYSVLAEACLMGVIGTVIGLLVGIPLQWYVLRIVILEESGYLFPVYIPWIGGLLIAGAALLVATVAGLGPAFHAVRMRIPEAIAYE